MDFLFLISSFTNILDSITLHSSNLLLHVANQSISVIKSWFNLPIFRFDFSVCTTKREVLMKVFAAAEDCTVTVTVKG